MGQKAVGQTREPLKGLLVVLRDGLLGEVPTGHHQRTGHIAQEDMVQRRVGQHQTQRTHTGGHIGATPPSETRRQRTIGAEGRRSSAVSASVSAHNAPAASRLPTMTAKALSGRPFRLRRSATAAALVASQANWYPPRPLIATICPAMSRSAAPLQRSIPDRKLRPIAIGERHLRPADRAGIGLGVESAVTWIIVLGLTLRAHVKARHRRGGAIVGYARDDGKARATVGAVCERIPIAPVFGIEQLAQAIGTGCDVGRDQLVSARLALAFQDRESLALGCLIEHVDRQSLDVRQGRRLRADGQRKGVYSRRQPLGSDLDAGRHVAHPARDAIAFRQAIDERAEPDALHHADDLECVDDRARVYRA